MENYYINVMIILRNKEFTLKKVYTTARRNPAAVRRFYRMRGKQAAHNVNILDPKVAGETVGGFVKRPGASAISIAIPAPGAGPLVYKPISNVEQKVVGNTKLYQRLDKTGNKVGQAVETSMLEAAPYHNYLPAGPGGQIYVRT